MTTSHDDLQRSLGRVEGKQDAMKDRMEQLEDTVAEGFAELKAMLTASNNRLAAIEARESERKGAWAALVAIASFVSSVLTGGIIAWLKGWLS